MGKNIGTKKENKTNGRMKEVLTNILLVLITGLIIYSLMMSVAIKTDVGAYYKRIDKIQTRIDSAYQVNKRLDLKLAKLDSNISFLNDEIQSVEKNINIIKKRTNEQVVSVDTFSNSELEEFFSKRYNPNISK